MQGLSLAAFIAEYEDQTAWYSVSLLFVPASLFWWYISMNNEGKPNNLFRAWLLYVWLGLVPLVGIVFGLTADKVESKGFLNLSTLKITTLCITPLLLLLLFHAGMDPKKDRKAIINLSFKVAIDLLDGIELLAVELEQNLNGFSLGVPKSFKNALISFALIGILCQSLLGIPNKEEWFDGGGGDRILMANSVSQVLLNTVFLGLRLGLIFGYGRVASLFITKNIAMIFTRLIEMKCISTRLGLEDDSTAARDT